MDIPHSLKEEIVRGRAILFLGAGASRGATNNLNQHPPLAPDLVKKISERFLGGKYQENGLATLF